MRVYGVQLAMAWEDNAANFQRVRELLGDARVAPGSLVVLPEMFATGFSQNVATVAEDPGGETEQFLIQLARTHQSTVVAGLATRADDGRGLNQALAVAPDGKLLARYTKIHPFSFGGEDRFFAPGDDIVSFDWGGLRVALFICYDLRFPEIYRHAALQGASVLVTIANFPATREGHWVALNPARAIENQAYVVAVNRAGSDPFHNYNGRSMVLDPKGMLIGDAGCQAAVVEAVIRPELVEQYRAEFRALQDARARFLGLHTSATPAAQPTATHP